MGITVEQLEQVHLIEDSNVLVEAGRRAISTLGNKRTLVSAGVYAVMGALTGGFGWAAGGVLLGGVAGRGTAEMGELFAGKTREARENVLYAEKARWERMQALAIQIRATKEDAVTQGSLTKELIDLMYRQGEHVLVRNLNENEKELSKREEKFNKIRNRLQTAGELVGAAAGVTSILNGGVEHLDMDFFNKIDGQSIFHGVQQTGAAESGWQFLYGSPAETAMANKLGADILAGSAHALEATTSQVIAYTIGERALPMLLASQLASIERRRTGEALAKFHHKNVGPDRYYTRPGPDGKKTIFTREEDGTYKRWEWQESEEKNGDKTKKVRKLVGTTVDQKDVPKRFTDRFIDRSETQDSRNAERLTNQMSEYIRKVADETHNPVPENPREFNYNWNEQPKVVDSVNTATIDRWYKFEHVNGKDEPRFDPNTGRIVEVGVLGVDVINNRIAYVRFEGASNGTEHSPVEVMRLDQFLKGFHLHLDAKAGSPVVEQGDNRKHDEDIIDAEFREVSEDEESVPEGDSGSDKQPTGKETPSPTTSSETKKPPTGTVRPEVDQANSEFEEKFLKGFYGDSKKTEGDTTDNSNKPKPEKTANKERKSYVETIKLPEGYKKFTKNELFDWLTDKLATLGDDALKAANIYYGKHETEGGNWKDWEFIKFQEPNGRERILNRYVEHKKGKDHFAFDISDSNPQKNGRAHPANVASMDLFTRHLLSQVNEGLRTGRIVPETELEPIEPENTGEPIPLAHDGTTTRIDRTQQSDQPVISRGGEFDTSIGARISGLESIRAAINTDNSNEGGDTEPQPQDANDRDEELVGDSSQPPASAPNTENSEEVVREPNKVDEVVDAASNNAELGNASTENVQVENESAIEISTGDHLRFREEFRNDTSEDMIVARKYLADSFFSNLEDNKRVSALMRSEFVVDELEEEIVSIKLVSNGTSMGSESVLIQREILEKIIER